MSTNIAIFASGSGSNVENIVQYFANIESINISLIVCNKPDAYVIERSKRLQIPCLLINKQQLNDANYLLTNLEKYAIDNIVLAGFLQLVPEYLIKSFVQKIINIHPALLPKYGGKGMYGHHVHRAVIENNESESGITIHFVNQNYDEGAVIFQAKCSINATDKVADVADKIHELEMEYFPKIIETWILS